MQRSHPDRMSCTRGLCMWAAILGVAVAQAAPPTPSGTFGSPLVVAGAARDGVVPLRIDPAAAAALRAAGGGVVGGLPVGAGRRVDVRLERLEVFAPAAQVVVVDERGPRQVALPAVDLYAGEVVSEPGSYVFLSLGRTVQGLIESSDGTFIIADRAGDGRPPVAYELSAVADRLDIRPWVCGTDRLESLGKAWAGPATRGTAACRRTQVAIETDHEYWQLFGNDSDATAYVATLIGAVSGIMTRDFNMRLEISYVRIWNTPNDPWTMNDAIDELYEFRDYWEANMGGVTRDLAHFLSARHMTSAGGVAWLPGVCQPGFNYGLSAYLNGFFPLPVQDNHSQNWDPMVVAHEMGHNFGAPHTHDMDPPIDNCAGGDCSVVPHGTIMSYCHTCSGGMTNIEMRYHSRITSEAIVPYLDTAGCDYTLAPPVISTPPGDQTACAGSDVTFSVSATGDPPLSYQWQKDGVDISGATDSTLVLTAVSAADAGSYTVIVSNDCGSVTSPAATLTVCTPGTPGDLNLDCTVDLNDLSILLGNFGGSGTPAEGDVNGDGVVDLLDLSALLANFGSGC